MSASSRIIAAVAYEFDVEPNDILGRSKNQTIALARHVAMTVYREAKGYSYPRIGRIFNRNHSSAFDGILRVLSRSEVDPDLSERLHRLIERERCQ